MLEILTAIRNNNIYKIPQYDPTLCEHFRKLLKGLLKAEKYVTTLNVTMNDLLNGKHPFNPLRIPFLILLIFS